MSEAAVKKVLDHARQGLEARKAFFEENAEFLVSLGKVMALCLANGNKILFCGNGGSAADSQHLAAEFVNRFKLERPPLPCIALTTDSSILTSIGNDYGFDQIFEKQVRALGQENDLLVGISTSGASVNVLKALREARQRGLTTVGMTGRQGGEMAHLCDYLIQAPAKDTAIIQEIHIAAGHVLCHLVDHFLFEEVSALSA
ncbi:MAG: D-sedoheptulose 7-phosphate isomerase [Desulfovibrionaceae bacterium]|nr:D-sedoheptulose 7-phosphate isomerase [Desulfovibrionaceae bacterium]